MGKQKTIPVPEARHLASAYLFIVGRHGDTVTPIRTWLDGLHIDPIDQVWAQSDEKISIDDVRALQRDALLAPVRSTRRAIILPAAFRLSPEAGHAMLKILEDPPAHALFVLGAEYEDQLLGTILSRCQRLHVNVSTTSPQAGAWSINEIRAIPYAARIIRAEQWAKEDDFLDQFDSLMVAAHTSLLEGALSVEVIERLLRYRSLASTNVTPRLLAEVTLLSLGKATQ